MSKKPETNFRNNVVDPFLKTLKNTHSFSVQQVSIKGTPDKLLCAHGTFVGMEIKALKGKTDPLQEYELSQIQRCGGIAIVCSPNNWPEVKELLLALDKGDFK